MDQSDILLSFVIPAFNEEILIGECLTSVCTLVAKHPLHAQMEIIVVNNASTDKTKQIAESFEGVKVVDEPQKSLYKARRAGAAVAKGKILAHIDSDTVLTDIWIDAALKHFNNPKVVALSGPYSYRDVSGIDRIIIEVFYRAGMISYYANKYFGKGGAIIQGGNFLVLKAAWDKLTNHSDSVTFYGEDTILAKELSKMGEVPFDFKLKILTSPRRFKKEWLIRVGIRYALNYFWIFLFSKPYTKGNTDIRG